MPAAATPHINASPNPYNPLAGHDPLELALANVLARLLYHAVQDEADPDPERTRLVAHYARYGITPDDLLAMEHIHDNSASPSSPEDDLRAWLMGEQ